MQATAFVTHTPSQRVVAKKGVRLRRSCRKIVAVAKPAAKRDVRVGATTASTTIRKIVTRRNDRLYNFSAGPACLPTSVLEQAQREMLNYKGSGMSVLEMSHRGDVFVNIAKQAEADLRTLLGIPDDYDVLFLQGGATTQFSAIPLNLTHPGQTVDYVITGSWSKKAAAEAGRYCKVNIAAKGDNQSIPDVSKWTPAPDAAYLHYCDNETIHGVEFPFTPEAKGRELVVDMSSNFCSKPIDVSKYGLIYAGAQKNIGGSGVTVVIIRKDLVGKAREETPILLNYQTMAETESMYNTPPCYPIYICGLVFKYLLRKGGLKKMQEVNVSKAKKLYGFIENSDGFYVSPVDPPVRSMMNVPFTIPSRPDLEKVFLEEATKMGLLELKGHRSVGGMRASIYNSMPVAGVDALIRFMKDFSVKFN